MNSKNKSVELGWSVPELIVKKRDGYELTTSQVNHLIEGFVSGKIPDYQMAAMAMAIVFKGMKPKETTALTLAMRDSGKVANLSRVSGYKVDKHSTGGVGDKVSICLAPIVASCGVSVPMISGRGLGHTGGTLDKLEAIPGFSVQMSLKKFEQQIRKLGCALIGQTANLAPADKHLYALRDVTGTVESIPLITASILCKKLAEGIEGLVLDVKVGRGAFMKTVSQAEALAQSIMDVGRLTKKRITAVLTRMDCPLGYAIGNALETREAFEVLHGRGPTDLIECTMVLGCEMLQLAGKGSGRGEREKLLYAAIRTGQAVTKMKQIVKAQGGDPRVVEEPDRLPLASRGIAVKTTQSGYINSIDALSIGQLAVRLGAGRTRVDQQIDPTAGILLNTKPGDRVTRGDVLARLYGTTDDKTTIRDLRQAFCFSERKPRLNKLVVKTIRM